jgi:hypothetical protein
VQTMGQGTSIATVSGPSGRANQIPWNPTTVAFDVWKSCLWWFM